MEWIVSGIVVALLVWLLVVAVMGQRRRSGSAQFTIDEHRDSFHQKPDGSGFVG